MQTPAPFVSRGHTLRAQVCDSLWAQNCRDSRRRPQAAYAATGQRMVRMTPATGPHMVRMTPATIVGPLV